jgi:hypothetical protein
VNSALGLKARTGRAVLVVLAGRVDAPRRDVLVAGARAAGIEPIRIAEKSALVDAAAHLGWSAALLALRA